MIRACETANEQSPIYHRAPPEQLASSQTHGCFSDIDHKVPRSILHSSPIPLAGYGRVILQTYIYSPLNEEQLCRSDHGAKNQLEAETGELFYPPPSLEVMVHALKQHYKDSGKNMPRSLRKAMKVYDTITDERQLIAHADERIKREYAA